MAKAPKLSQLLIGKEVVLNFNLCDISGEPHPAAGKRATVIERNSRAAYQVATEDGAVYVVQESDWTPYPNQLHPGTLAEQLEVIGLYTDTALNKVHQLKLGRVRESPFNPRTNFAPEEMQDLADSVKAVGIMQPVLVRPLANGDYELVFGHRRHRAAQLAGLGVIPAIVRDLNDAKSAQLQAVENVQRRDLDPIDEALGYAAMLATHGMSKDELAVQIGKSRTHVYNRLKLATLHPEGQAALRAGKLRAEVATLVARVPGAKNQAKALALALEGGFAGELKSYRTARAELTEKFTLDLKGALWALDDADLVAGAGACTGCPSRSGVDPIVYADFVQKQAYNDYTHKGENICTDSDCFAAKKAAQLKREQEALEAKGKLVVSGNAARKALDAYGKVKSDYIPVSDVKDELKRVAKAGTAGPAVTTLTVQDPRTGKTVEVVKRKEAEAAGLAIPATPVNADLEWEEKRKAREVEAQRQSEENMSLLLQVRAVANMAPAGTFELRLMAQAALAGVGYYDHEVLAKLYDVEDTEAIKVHVKTMNSTQLMRLMLDCALVHNTKTQTHYANHGKEPGPLLAAAQQYGIEAEAEAAAAAAAAAA